MERRADSPSASQPCIPSIGTSNPHLHRWNVRGRSMQGRHASTMHNAVGMDGCRPTMNPNCSLRFLQELRNNLGTIAPEHRVRGEGSANQNARRVNTIDNLALPAKPPSPVQIRAAPPIFSLSSTVTYGDRGFDRAVRRMSKAGCREVANYAARS